MDELKKQLTAVNEEAFWTEHNRSFFYQSCLEQIEEDGFQFETTKEIVKLSQQALNP